MEANGSYAVELDRDEFGPGDEVSGRVTARQPAKKLRAEVQLRYVVRAGSFESGRDADVAELDSAALAAGRPASFRLQLPEAAAPPKELRAGRLLWGLVVRTKRRLRSDLEEVHELPFRAAPGTRSSLGPGAGELPAWALGPTEGWDVELRPDRARTLLGDEIRCAITIGEPDPQRRLELTLVCTFEYHGVGARSDDPEIEGAVTKRSEEWSQSVELDAGLGEQEVVLTVPREGAATYPRDGWAELRWEVAVSEQFEDGGLPPRRRRIEIEVLPA